jgi:hypothetical protein
LNPASLDAWIGAFRNGIAPPDVDAELAKAFLHHLADIGLFRVDGESWTAEGIDGGLPADRLRAELLPRLDALSATERGFAAHFFLAHKSGLPPVLPEGLQLDAPQAKSPSTRQTALPGRTADPSNLQIVKKLSRQLQPFLDLEKNFLARLAGTFTTRQDAQKIFHYVLGKIHPKTAPMRWEQLSRRKHK